MVCSPHTYYSDSHQAFIAKSCQRDNRQWIYELIFSGANTANETVILDRGGWLLCLDKHPGSDVRYLIVFRDHHLKTIRDLRGSDVAMLEEVRADVARTLAERHPQWTSSCVYFHYNPSVYQLHAHVCEHPPQHGSHISVLRCHELKHVIRNLRAQPLWYRDALILTSKTKHPVRAPPGRGEAGEGYNRCRLCDVYKTGGAVPNVVPWYCGCYGHKGRLQLEAHHGVPGERGLVHDVVQRPARREELHPQPQDEVQHAQERPGAQLRSAS